jgi:sugar phosphate isomerase/epimerase
MKIGIFTILFNEKPLSEVAQYVSSLGYEMVELSAWKGSNHLDIDRVISDKNYVRELKETLEKFNLKISAVSNHLEGQLVLGPLDESTDDWAPSKDPEEKVKYGIERMIKTAQAVSVLCEVGIQERPIVNGFTGSNVWDKWYIFPPKNEEIYEKAWNIFAERWNKILDKFKEYGVKFALEVHPTEIAYNIETAERAVKALNERPEFGFNFDPSHFVWQLIDPVIFIKRLGDRIFHAHAKDSELQQDEIPRSGIIPTGSWMRLDRGFRFRVPGWGDVNWKRIITAFVTVGYDYVLSYEHEDPVMSREDGCEKCIQFLKPLIIKAPLKEVWW